MNTSIYAEMDKSQHDEFSQNQQSVALGLWCLPESYGRPCVNCGQECRPSVNGWMTSMKTGSTVCARSGNMKHEI